MGAENSHSSSGQEYSHRGKWYKENGYITDEIQKSHPKGKPPPPEGFPKATEVSHDSAKLSWLPVKGQSSGCILAYTVEVFNLSEKRWRVITRTCQGATYYVRNLTPDSKYYFRVRAENIYGVGKPSQITDIVRTRYLSDSLEQLQTKNKPLTRSCSYTLELENGVQCLMNRSNREGEHAFQRSSLRMSLPILQRKNSFRMSLPPQQRKPVTSFLPGSRRESVCSMKDAVISMDGSVVVEPSESDCSGDDQRLSMASTEEDSSAKSSSGVSMTSLPSNEDTFSDNHDIDTDDYFVHKLQPTSCDIMEASVSDDTKLDTLYSKSSMTETYHAYPRMQCNGMDENPVWRGRSKNVNNRYNFSDLRSVRQVLRSSDVLVKMSNNDNGHYNSLPYHSFRNKKLHPSAIKEVEEEDIPMDRVSTL